MVQLVTLTLLIGVLLPPAAAGASPVGCPPTPEADQFAKGTVASDNDWWYHWLDPKRLWQVSTGRGVKVAVVDTGVNPHRQLAGAVRPGFDIVRDIADGRLDCTGHGTAIASLIAARPARGLAGLAPQAQIVPVRVAERSFGMNPDLRVLPSARLAAGIRWAADNVIPIINVPLVVAASDELADAVAYAIGKGCVVVAPVGKDQPSYPAAYPGVIGVAAIDRGGERDEAVAKEVDLYAPGRDVVVAARDTDHFRWAGGADAASAIVSATAALIKASVPEATAEQIGARLRTTATGGLIDPYRAVTEMMETPRFAPVPHSIVKGVQERSTLPTRALHFAGGLLVGAILIVFVARLARRRP